MGWGGYFRFSTNCFSSFVVVMIVAAVDGVSEVRVTTSFPMSSMNNKYFFWYLVII